MATQAIPGFSGLLFASTAAATTAAPSTTPVAELQECVISLDQVAIAATSKDSAGWDEFLPGIRKWTVTGKGYYRDMSPSSSAPSGQGLIANAIMQQVKMGATFRATSSSGIMNWLGGVIVTKFALSNPLDKANEYDFAANGTGSISILPSTS